MMRLKKQMSEERRRYSIIVNTQME